jgi:hypothetical protein
MGAFSSRYGLSRAARISFAGGLIIFVYTIVIGILNGTDIWEPNHDHLMSHVHSGTLGWITLCIAGIGFLMFSRDRSVPDTEAKQATNIAWSMVGAITLYILAFFLGDALFDDRIQRPIVGTLLFIVVIWYLVWLVGTYRRMGSPGPAQLGFVLGWTSLLIGAVFGVILGLYLSNGEVPGLSNDTAAAVAEAHPPAMVIGYLLLMAFATIEWLLYDDTGGRAARTQMWLLFIAGLIINIAFVAGLDEQLAGPANLLMIVAGGMLLWRSRDKLAPDGWRNAGAGVFPRLAMVFLVVYLVLLSVLVSWIVTGAIDFNAVTEAQEGLLLAFDHTMFIGVMTNVLFGVLAANLGVSARRRIADRILQWGVNVGIAGFGVGLITRTALLKRTFTPIMGLALLVGIAVYLMAVRERTTA